MKKIKYSFIIATKNRPEDLSVLMRSLSRLTEGAFEIVIIDQSDKENSCVKNTSNLTVKYLHVRGTGKTKALNIGIKEARGEFYIFTDDDCVLPKNYLTTLKNIRKLYPNVEFIHGAVLPFFLHRNKNCYCPAVTDSDSTKMKIFSDVLDLCSDYAGSGNNMCIHRDFFKRNNIKFAEWLGTGTKVGSGEEPLLQIEALLQGYSIYFIPQLVVYHNRWLDSTAYQSQKNKYAAGTFTAYLSKIKEHPLLMTLLILALLKEELKSRLWAPTEKPFF